jgi:hypothetical protein
VLLHYAYCSGATSPPRVAASAAERAPRPPALDSRARRTGASSSSTLVARYTPARLQIGSKHLMRASGEDEGRDQVPVEDLLCSSRGTSATPRRGSRAPECVACCVSSYSTLSDLPFEASEVVAVRQPVPGGDEMPPDSRTAFRSKPRGRRSGFARLNRPTLQANLRFMRTPGRYGRGRSVVTPRQPNVAAPGLRP